MAGMPICFGRSSNSTFNFFPSTAAALALGLVQLLRFHLLFDLPCDESNHFYLALTPRS